ncbi:MAG: hypothetical protein V1659_02335 [Candidatus Woesearchaeota archaeon]
MEETDQFNIRLPKALIYDLEFVAQYKKLSRNDWLRVKIAELITSEREEILETISHRFIRGLISGDEFRKATGITPTQGMLESRQRTLQAQEDAKKAHEKYIMDIAAKVEKRDLGHIDKYLTKIMKKTEKERKKEKKKNKL